MYPTPGYAFFNGTADKQIVEQKAYVAGVIILASVAGGDITLHDGRGNAQGRKFATLKGDANISLPIMFDKPVCFENGIYVDVGSNITEYTVLWYPANNPFENQVENQ